MPDTHLILHVKGTEQETTTLPKAVVRAAISQGQLTHSQLIWSPTDHAWKQVRELPHLLPSQKLAPAPVRAPTGALPEKTIVAARMAETPQVKTPQPQLQSQGAVPRVSGQSTPTAQKPAMRATARVRVGGQADPSKKTQSLSHLVEDKHTSHPLKWVCIIAGLVVFGALGVNYFMVDEPLVERFSHTSYSSVPVYAHLGGFMEPGVLLVHVPVTATVNQDNLIDFLVAVAKSTPKSPFTGKPFDHVELTPGWTGRYSFTGEDWKALGEMGVADEERKTFLLDKLADSSGNPMITAKPNWSETAKQEERDKVWNAFSYLFTKE